MDDLFRAALAMVSLAKQSASASLKNFRASVYSVSAAGGASFSTWKTAVLAKVDWSVRSSARDDTTVGVAVSA